MRQILGWGQPFRAIDLLDDAGHLGAVFEGLSYLFVDVEEGISDLFEVCLGDGVQL